MFYMITDTSIVADEETKEFVHVDNGTDGKTIELCDR